MLDKLKEMTGGDEARMQLYLKTYKEGVAEYIESLSAAYDLQDNAIAKTIAHGAKPLFTVVGLQNLWDIANNLEIAIDDGLDQSAINKLIKDLVREMQKSLKPLENH